MDYAKDLHQHQLRKIHYITNATIHIGTGNVLQNASIVFENGKITQINGTNSNVKGYTMHRINTFYPGFILVNNTLGLVEIETIELLMIHEK